MSIFEQLISIIAPVSCIGCGQEGLALCEGCSTSVILPYGERCWRCSKLSPGCKTCSTCKSFRGPSKVWISAEYSGLSKEIIKSYKFQHSRSASSALASHMHNTLLSYLSDDQIRSRRYLIIPVPTATSRIRQRGFDHSSLLAFNVAKLLGQPMLQSLSRHGQLHQVGASREQRLKQPAGSFYIKSPSSVNGRNILLIDDVVTTGATIKEAAKVLRKAGTKRVDALVFAKKL